MSGSKWRRFHRGLRPGQAGQLPPFCISLAFPPETTDNRSMPRYVAITAVLLCLAGPATAQVRTWTDGTGKYRLEAELADFNGGMVILKRSDGHESRATEVVLQTNDVVLEAKSHLGFDDHQEIRSRILDPMNTT